MVISKIIQSQALGRRHPLYFSILSNNFYAKFGDDASNGIDAILKTCIFEEVATLTIEAQYRTRNNFTTWPST